MDSGPRIRELPHSAGLQPARAGWGCSQIRLATGGSTMAAMTESQEGRHVRTLFGLLTVATILSVGVQPAHAAAPASMSAGVSSAPATWSGAAGLRANPDTYWTPARMRAAIPAEAPAAHSAGRPTPVGAPGAAAAAAPKGFAATTAAVGKVFYRDPADGKTYWCAGSTVNSASKRLVITAAHCIHGGVGKSWMQNWVFVPGYDQNAANPRPFGTWSAHWFNTFDQWKNSNDTNRDVGFVVLWPDNAGRSVVNVVGGNGLTWNQAHEQSVTMVTYPGAWPFDGSSQVSCSGTTSRLGGWPSAENRIGLSCHSTAGGSGGPWLTQFNGSLGNVNGVNSDGTAFFQKSPYFDGEVSSLFNTMAALM